MLKNEQILKSTYYIKAEIKLTNQYEYLVVK
jgi:hypothetical protein